MSPNNPSILDDKDLFNSSFSLFSPERTRSGGHSFADDFDDYLSSSSDGDQMYISESSEINSLNGEAVYSSDSEVDYPREQPLLTLNGATPCTPNGRDVFSYSHNSALAARSLPGAIDGLDSLKDQIKTLWKSPVNVSNRKKPKALKSSTLAKQTKALKSSQLSGRKPRKSGRAVKKHEPYTPGKPSNYRGPSSAI